MPGPKLLAQILALGKGKRHPAAAFCFPDYHSTVMKGVLGIKRFISISLVTMESSLSTGLYVFVQTGFLLYYDNSARLGFESCATATHTSSILSVS